MTIPRLALPLLCVALTTAALPVGAQGPEPAEPARQATEEIDDARLEDMFWLCDFKATTEGMHAVPIRACRFATERLKQRKFGGNFDAFLAWWREHKSAAHARLAQG